MHFNPATSAESWPGHIYSHSWHMVRLRWVPTASLASTPFICSCMAVLTSTLVSSSSTSKEHQLGLRAENSKKMGLACSIMTDLSLSPSSNSLIRPTHRRWSLGTSLAARVSDDRQPHFTSYDFWCSGIKLAVLQPVEEVPERWA